MTAVRDQSERSSGGARPRCIEPLDRPASLCIQRLHGDDDATDQESVEYFYFEVPSAHSECVCVCVCVCVCACVRVRVRCCWTCDPQARCSSLCSAGELTETFWMQLCAERPREGPSTSERSVKSPLTAWSAAPRRTPSILFQNWIHSGPESPPLAPPPVCRCLPAKPQLGAADLSATPSC